MFSILFSLLMTCSVNVYGAHYIKIDLNNCGLGNELRGSRESSKRIENILDNIITSCNNLKDLPKEYTNGQKDKFCQSEQYLEIKKGDKFLEGSILARGSRELVSYKLKNLADKFFPGSINFSNVREILNPYNVFLKFKLSNNNLDNLGEDILKLTSLVMKLEMPFILDISQNNLGNLDIYKLLEGLGKVKVPLLLKARDNNLNNLKSMEQFNQLLLNYSEIIFSWDLSNNKLKDLHLEYAFNNIDKISRPFYVNLSNNDLGMEGLVRLWSYLDKINVPFGFNLSHNHISDELSKCKLSSQALSDIRQPFCLNLSNNFLTKKALKRLIKGIWPKLRDFFYINMSNNELYNESFMKVLSRLNIDNKYFVLQNNPAKIEYNVDKLCIFLPQMIITDDALANDPDTDGVGISQTVSVINKMVKAANCNRSELKYITVDLSNNVIGDTGLENLIKCLKENFKGDKEISIDLSHNTISSDGISLIQKVLGGNLDTNESVVLCMNNKVKINIFDNPGDRSIRMNHLFDTAQLQHY